MLDSATRSQIVADLIGTCQTRIPLPLLTQLAAREGDAVEVSYLQRGPEAWRLRLHRIRWPDRPAA